MPNEKSHKQYFNGHMVIGYFTYLLQEYLLCAKLKDKLGYGLSTICGTLRESSLPKRMPRYQTVKEKLRINGPSMTLIFRIW